MQDSKKDLHLLDMESIFLKTIEEKEYMKIVPYASTVGSLMFVMLCTRPDTCY